MIHVVVQERETYHCMQYNMMSTSDTHHHGCLQTFVVVLYDVYSIHLCIYLSVCICCYHCTTLQIPTITVGKQSDATDTTFTCSEGETIVLIADATTAIDAITAAGFTFTWSTTDDNHGTVTATDSTLVTTTNKKNVFSYACTVAGPHRITVAATANHHDYAVNSEPQASFTITVNNGPPMNPSATFKSSDSLADLQGQPLAVYYGDVVQLTFKFTDASLTNVHTFTLDWGDGSATAIVTQTNADLIDKRTFTAQHVYSPVEGFASKEYTVQTMVTDNVDATSHTEVNTQLKLTRKVMFIWYRSTSCCCCISL